MSRGPGAVQSLSKRMQKISILYDASQAVLSTFRLDEVLARILDILGDYFQIEHRAILLLDPRSNTLRVHSHNGWLENAQRHSIPLGEGITGRAAAAKRPLYVADVSNFPGYIAGSPTTRSEFAIPLMVRDRVAGVLDVQSDQLDFLDNETQDLLTVFSTQASIAIHNAQLYALERRRATQLEAINAIARQTTNVLDVPELLTRVCTLALSAFGADHVSIMLAENDTLVLRANAGSLTPTFGGAVPVPPSFPLCGRAFVTSSASLVRKVEPTPTAPPLCKQSRSELALPLIAVGSTLGVLVLDSATEDAFDPTDMQPLESVADICAGAIQNARYFDQVRQLAYRDGLTGVFNRRYFETRILEEISRANRYQSEVSVLMIDVDQFKQLNDEFGHLLGDEVLRRMSGMFTQHLRTSDIVCRYGGDEFAVLLPETDNATATSVAEKLRRLAECCEFAGVPRPVTLSIGVASVPVNGTTRDQVIKAADEALYLAKQSGRNRVRSAVSAAAQQ
jgi:diguanylate cyclase (GGDEF)-like protein